MKDRLELNLRDGTPVIVRPLLEEDRALVAEAYRRLSPEARYQRFWTRTGEMLGDAMLDRLVRQDPARHMTWAVRVGGAMPPSRMRGRFPRWCSMPTKGAASAPCCWR